MPVVPVYNIEGQVVDQIELDDRIFKAPVSEALLHQVVVMNLAAKRSGTASTKTRAEVRGGGRKPWRQKGTGWARHGSRRSPIWRHGGVAFGPKPRDYGFTMPKKARRLALCGALTKKVELGYLTVLEGLDIPERPRTKEVVKMLNNLEIPGSAVIVTAEVNQNVVRSARNIPGITTAPAPDLNVYDVLSHKHLIMTKDAINKVQEVLLS
jgi:large subunit ribosomal protein L4